LREPAQQSRESFCKFTKSENRGITSWTWIAVADGVLANLGHVFTIVNSDFWLKIELRYGQAALVGLRIKQARKEAKMTQMELAAQLQLMNIAIDRSMVAKLESGLRPVSDIEIMAMARVLKVPVSLLFEGSVKLFSQLAS
jgi:DNA-binding XRE family transcriptional regulator